MIGDRATPPAGSKTLAKAGLAFFVGMMLCVVAAMVLWPAIERSRYSEIARPLIVNKRSEAILVYSIDVAGNEVHRARIEPGTEQHVVLARGMVGAEFEARTILVVVMNERGVEIGSANLTGRVGQALKTFTVSDAIELRGQDDRIIDVGALDE